MTIGMVSAGHMGSGLGWALREGGATVITTVDGRSPRTAKFARDAGLGTVPSLADVVRLANVILVVTPPGEARHAADEIARAAVRTGAAPLVADLNATAPSTVDEIAAVYASSGLTFVDGSISGPPPNVRPGARLYFSGERAGEIAGLPWRHVRPIVLDGPAGKASSLKMCTASVYKGLDGLVAQALRAAAEFGVLDEVVADLHSGGVDRAVQVAVAATKAHRYVPEMLQ